MRLTREFAISTVVVLVLLIGLDSVLTTRHDVRNYEIFTEMVVSKAQESFQPSSVLPGELTQQEVIPGVVIRGSRPFSYGSGTSEAQRAGRELSNPVADATPEVLERGREVFGAFCANCHDSSGEGRGPVVLRGMLPPPSLLAARAVAMSDGEIFHVITRGQGNMASHAAQVSADDRWKTIRWLRVLQEGSR